MTPTPEMTAIVGIPVMSILQVMLAIVIPFVAVIVWLVRLEGRVNLNERLTSDLQSDVSEIKRDVKLILNHAGWRRE